jgi:hypothetical protein
MCGLTGTLICDECDGESILKIDMLGIILRLCNSSVFMCPTCCQLALWKGIGNDLTSCACQPIVSDPIGKTCCSVCNSRYVVTGPFLYPDTLRNRVVRVFLCGKHVLPKHIMNFIHEYSDFQNAIRTHKRKKDTRLHIH